MIIVIAIMVGIGLGKWLIYTGLLWLMIKIQKLNYNLLGLLGSSLLATALGYIPIVGQYVGWAVLIICLWKCTGANIAPDILFTVGVAGALMFCVNLFAIGALMGSLMLAAPAIGKMVGLPSAPGNFAQMEKDEEDEPTNSTNDVHVAGSSSRTNGSGSRMNLASAKASAASLGAISREGRALAQLLTLKGVGLNSRRKSAMIASGKQIYTFGLGETLSVSGGGGSVMLTCEDISQSYVTLAMEQGEKIKVGFQ